MCQMVPLKYQLRQTEKHIVKVSLTP